MMLDEKIKKIIIQRFLNPEGEDSPELENWLGRSPENRQLYKKILNRENWKDWEIQRQKIDAEAYWGKLAGLTVKPKRSLMRRIMIGAAVLALFLGSGLLYYFLNPVSETGASLSGHIVPGTSKAYVLFSDGRSMNLNHTQPAQCLDQDGVLIQVDSGRLNYLPSKPGIVNITYHTLIVPKGGEYILTLEDGTVVQLNSQSTLRYPVCFGEDKREVFLEGEAYFRVKHTEQIPFIVRTQGMDVRVKGTEFNVRAYLDEQLIQTTLVNGHVEVSAEKEIFDLTPGLQAELDLASRATRVRPVDPWKYIAWTEGWFIFMGERLEDIMNELARWYDFEVFYQNPDVRDMVFGGKLDRSGSIEPILKVIGATLTVNVSIRGKTIVFSAR